MHKLRLLTAIIFVGALALIAGACVPVPSTQAETGTLNVYVTDAPPGGEVTSIMVTVSEVKVHKAGTGQDKEEEETTTDNQSQQDEGEWLSIDISDDDATFDLLEVTGVEQYLGTAEIEAAKYTQVRLVIEEVGVEFDGSGELEEARIPSKVLKIARPFTITEGQTTVLVIDFEADKMVTVTGAGSVIVKPVVKLSIKQEVSDEEDGTEPIIGLEDTRWILQSYGESENLTYVLVDSVVSAEFISSEGNVIGSTGCNNYSGGYELDGNLLSVPGPVAVTEMYCMEPEGVMDQEQEYLTLLQLAESYEIEGDELRITCGSRVLFFKSE